MLKFDVVTFFFLWNSYSHTVLVVVCMQQLRIFLLCLLILHQCMAMPLSNQCVGETLCTYTLKDYYNQMTNLPGDVNTRSLATWVYQ